MLCLTTVVEMHLLDQVLLQFGLLQYILDLVEQVDWLQQTGEWHNEQREIWNTYCYAHAFELPGLRFHGRSICGGTGRSHADLYSQSVSTFHLCTSQSGTRSIILLPCRRRRHSREERLRKCT